MMWPKHHFVSVAALLPMLNVTPTQAALGPPAILGYVLLVPLAVPLGLGIWLAVRRNRRQVSFVRDMLWISPVGVLVVALGFAIPNLDSGPYRVPAILALLFGVLVLAGYLLARFVAAIIR
jgi:hypothetical protein